MKKIIFVLIIIMFSGLLSYICFQFAVEGNIFFVVMSLYWTISGIIYFKKFNTNIFLPLILISFYAICNLFIQVRLARLGEIILLRKISTWTNFGFIPFFRQLYIPQRGSEVVTFKMYGIMYFVFVNILFYLRYIFKVIYGKIIKS